MIDLGTHFLDASRHYLREDYLPKIRLAVAALPAEDLWWRPNPASNSIGNLLVHLAGNVTQWIVTGIGGAPEVRDRPAEFARAGGLSAGQTLGRLEDAVLAADGVLAGFPASGLGEPRRIQGHDVSVLEAIYHVVEHFSTHTGQILWITKARTGRDLGFYAVTGNVALPRWKDLEEPTGPATIRGASDVS